MNRILARATVVLLLLAGLQSSFAQQRTVSAEREKAEIKKTLLAQGQAASDFPRTRDAQAYFRFYAPEYTQIEDGELTTLADEKKEFKNAMVIVNQGYKAELSLQYSNISVDLNGDTGWATYDSSLTMSSGARVKTINRKCTSIFKHSGTGWLIIHDHCSMLKPARSATPRMDNN
jgi:ketosteroid isomerase-like protein